MPVEERRVAQAVVEQLTAHGVTDIFGVAGFSIFPLLDALARQDRIRFFAVRHEENAALMASAYAKLTGRLGVCLVHAGPGTAHLANGLMDAFQDGAPVLALSGQLATAKMGTSAPEWVDTDSLLAAVSHYRRTVSHPVEAVPLLAEAMARAVAMNHVSSLALPLDIQSQPTSHAPRPPGPYLTARPRPDEEDLDRAAAILLAAKKPVMLVGRGARDLGPEILSWADRLHLPLLVTLPAKGTLPEEHPLVLGVVGEAGNRAAEQAFRGADAVLVAASTWWPEKFAPKTAQVVQIDQSPCRIGAGHPVAVGLAGDVREVLPRLLERVHRTGDRAWLEDLRRQRDSWQKEMEAPSDDLPLHPARLMSRLRGTLPRDAILAVDVGSHTLWFGGTYRARQEQILLSGRWRTMGFSVPAAIAAAIAQPDRTVVALTGDGGFGMVLGEFLTAVEYELPVTVVVVNNGSLAEEGAKQEQQGYQPFGIDLKNPDFAAFAIACGGQGYRVTSDLSLDTALRKALEAKRPAVIDVPTAVVSPPYLEVPNT